MRVPSLLMVAYAFPPEGNAGAHRPLRFVRHLPALGWTPVVVTAVPPAYERYDPELERLIPEAIEVIRVPVRDVWQSLQWRRAQRISHALAHGSSAAAARIRKAQHAYFRGVLREAVRRAESWCYHPDMAMRWIRPAVDAAVEVAARHHPDVIWATAGPVSSFIVAKKAALRTGLPYVLDFRDAWTITYNEFEARRPAWAARADRRALHELLSNARAVTFRYPAEAECYWRLYPGALDPARVHIIPNGYDGTIADDDEPPPGDRCTILYAGTLSSYRYDTLLMALSWLKQSDPDRAAQLRLVMLGEGASAVAEDASALGVSDIVETADPASHATVERLQRQAHALLVLGRPPDMKGHELFAAAKLFGYLPARRPILGVLPQDEARRILGRIGVTTIAHSDSVSDIAGMCLQIIDAWRTGTLKRLAPDRSACRAYAADVQTTALARAIEGKPAADPFVPGVIDVPASLADQLRAAEESRPLTLQKRNPNAVLHS